MLHRVISSQAGAAASLRPRRCPRRRTRSRPGRGHGALRDRDAARHRRGQWHAQAWIPLPSVDEPDWFRSLGSKWTTNAPAALERDAKYGAEMLHVEWGDGEKAPSVEVTSTYRDARPRDRLRRTRQAGPLSAGRAQALHAATELIPTDGIVKATSDKITAGARTDVDKARAHLRMDRRQHVPRRQDARLRHRRHRRHAEDAAISAASAPISTRSMSASRAPPACPPATSTACAWRPRSSATRASAPARRSITKAQHCRAEVYLVGLRLGAGRSRRRAQGGAGGAAGQPAARRRQGRRGPQDAVRRMGDELARLQHRARRGAAGLAAGRRSAS